MSGEGTLARGAWSLGGNVQRWRTLMLICGIAGVAAWAYFSIVLSPHETMRWYDWLRVAGMLWTLAFGILIGWRRPDSPTVCLLSAALILYTFFDGILVIGNTFSDARLHGSFAVGVGEVGIAISSCVLVARFVSRFGPLTPVRRAALLFAYAAAAGTAIAAVLTPFVQPGKWLYAFTDPDHYAVPRIAVLVCGMLAIAVTRGEERQRVGWPFASFAVLYLVSIAGFFGSLPQVAFDALVRLSLFVLPLGLTYSALNRRLYDVGFILNRATVFAGITGIIVGSFVLLEWILGNWFGQASREAGLAANVALALALGVSLSFVHRRVDVFVDNVFFKKRHEDVLALKRFAREAGMITDLGTLLNRTRDEVLEHSEASGASVMFLGAAGAAVSLDDPAMLAMRTWHEPVELHRFKTAIMGEIAFPMLAHGTLLGALVCGEKRSGEGFAPDEVDALKTLAHGVGMAIDGLSRSGDNAVAPLHAAVAALRQDLMARLDALSAEIRDVRH